MLGEELEVTPTYSVSIVVVNYNSGELLHQCVESLFKYVKIPFEVIVVDNRSTDNSVDLLPQAENIRILKSPENLGFAKASNLGAKLAKSRLIHFLNPDARVTETVNNCYGEGLNGARAIYVTRIFDTRTSHDRSCHPFPTLENIFYLVFSPAKVTRWFLGASVVMSRKVFDELGGWSEDYFMYAEDLDLFYKARQAQIPTVMTDALVVHDQGGTTTKIWTERERLERVEHSAFIFASKFGLRLEYFLFRHAAFFKVVWKRPRKAYLEMIVFWREVIRSLKPSDEGL